MTMIAFATYGNRAEFMTDTISYTNRMESLGRSTKHLLLPHMDAAVLTNGDSSFGAKLKVSVMIAAGDMGTFDALAEEFVQPMAQAVWEDARADFAEADPGNVFLIGYSDRAGRFVAYQYAARHEFERVEIKGLFVTPSPFSIRPSKLEVENFRDHLAEHPEIAQERVEQMVHTWTRKRKPLPPPASSDEWVHLAMMVREERALEYFSRIPVGGDVFHTVMGRGRAHTDRIHRYNDAGEEFATLVQRSMHPIALAGPCYCGSEKNYGECCCVHNLEESRETVSETA